jgi:rhomboid family GlyGly-CTERM serine protease
MKSVLTRRPELVLFATVLVLCNWPVLTGNFVEALVFRPAAVGAGQWWRLLTHPFVHVTWYHLTLDSAAFLMLLASLAETSIVRRMAYMIAAAAGALLTSLVAAPAVWINGLCGLSGVAHGLMAVSALELFGAHPVRSTQSRYGLFAFLLVVGKAGFEAFSGELFFSAFHLGSLGDPVAVSHAGGIIGALGALFWFTIGARPRSTADRLPVGKDSPAPTRFHPLQAYRQV